MYCVIGIRKQKRKLKYYTLVKIKENQTRPGKYLFLNLYRKSIIYASDAHLNSTIDVNHSRAPPRKSN